MRCVPVLAAMALAACAGSPETKSAVSAAPSGIALRNPGFEAEPRAGERCPVEWICTMHADPGSFRFVLDSTSPAEGARSLCIERVTQEPWAVASLVVPAQTLRGRRVRFSLALRGERLGGPGGGPWVVVNGPAGTLLHEERVALLGSKWERRAIEFQVPAQALDIEIGATLQGSGRICLDDARLEPV